jgi:hypothetical protein
MDIGTDIASYLVPAALVVYVIARQFVGRWVPARRSLLLPLVLVVVGVGQAAHVGWTAQAVVVVGVDVLLTAGLGVVRGAAIRLTLRDGYLYQRGGWLSVGLWLLTIAVRVGAAAPFLHTSAGPALEATLAMSFGISLAVQYAVFNARVVRDGRPVRPGGDRRRTGARSTLAR